jgi:prephenate dehydratase
MSKRIAIQGVEGSFHQVAAQQFFGEVEIIPCSTFRELIDAVENDKDCDAGMMAIENSIAGSILPNYNLLHASDLTIVGEVYLPISQNLLVNPGVKLEDIREVHSHTMALQQSYDFLDKYDWKLVEAEDTALSAKRVHESGSKHTAAIASKLAAELFGLEVLAPDIQTEKQNYTRFLALVRSGEAKTPEGANKASVSFHTDHSRGSLARVLTQIADAGINLSKLQSFPIPGSNFNYNFHADMEFESMAEFEDVLERIRPLTNSLRVYGVYVNGNNLT